MDDCKTSFDERFQLLQNYIKGAHSVEMYSEMFTSLKRNHEKVEAAYSLLLESKLLPDMMKVHPKSTKESTLFREKGNKEFLTKQDLLAIQTYSVSAAFANPGSEELALAFANRSAVTYSLKDYNSCIKDIDRALSSKYPDHLRYKLYERKGKSLKCLGLDKSAKDTFQIAIDNLPQCRLERQKAQAILTSLTNDIKGCSDKDKDRGIIKQCLPCLSGEKNEFILAASSLIRVEFTEELGRYLVATSDIEPGDVLVVEQPYASVLLPAAYNNYCFHCKKRCHALIPCLYCVVAMFCGEECRSLSWDESHRIECSLLPLLVALDFTKIELIAVRTLLKATEQSASLQELIKKLPEIDAIETPRTKGVDEKNRYNSADYRSVHHLVGNLGLRSNADVFRRATTAAFILHLLDRYTNYFASSGDIDSIEVVKDSNFNLLEPSKRFVGGLLFRYLMIVPSNAHEISEMVISSRTEDQLKCESVEIGGALYPVLSLINHSCDPNVVRHSHNGDINVLTAIQFIQAGEQIFDNYGYHHALHDLSTRQNRLWGQYHFRCQCRACLEDWPVYAELPSSNIDYLKPNLADEVKKSSEIFLDVLSSVNEGAMEGKLPFLCAHLGLLHRAVRRPWKEYSECQEAMKQCLSVQANHYICH